MLTMSILSTELPVAGNTAVPAHKVKVFHIYLLNSRSPDKHLRCLYP